MHTTTIEAQKTWGSTPLRSMAEIRRFFRENETPFFFINASDWNMMGAHAHIGNFYFITAIDNYEGRLPQLHVLTPRPDKGYAGMSLEEINTRLLKDNGIRQFIRSKAKPGMKSKALFLMFDDANEKLAHELDLDIYFPSHALREGFDNKINTVRLAAQAGVPSVPNVLSAVRSYTHLREVAGHLGADLVVQKAFGDSGRTTFFISDEADFNAWSEQLTTGEALKIMKRIQCRATAIEGCATAKGTIVGPLMSEVIGFPELTPFPGAWCGNELCAGIFDTPIRQKALQYTVRIGDLMYQQGYKGYFELDFLIDVSDGALYLGEINPRLSGASPMTNQSAFAEANAPLYLFHLLEWMHVEYELDIASLNEQWSTPEASDQWSQMLIKNNGNEREIAGTTPRSGIWRLSGSGDLQYSRPALGRQDIQGRDEGLLLCIPQTGNRSTRGGELVRLMLQGRVMDESYELTDRARQWATGIRDLFEWGPETGA